MPIYYNILLIIQIIVSVAIIILVLVQQGKGADAGAAFGSGASGTVFGARGSANFLSRTTAILATIFFVNSIGLAFLASGRPISSGSIMDSLSAAPQVKEAPVVPASNGDIPPAPPAANAPAATGDIPPAPPAAQTQPAAEVKPATVETKPTVTETKPEASAPKAEAKPAENNSAKKPADDKKPVH